MKAVSTTILRCHYNANGLKVYRGGLLRGDLAGIDLKCEPTEATWLTPLEFEFERRPGLPCHARIVQ